MAKSSQLSKKKKKIWITILSPREFNNKEIGETHVYDTEKVIGKRVSCNLSFLINDPKKQNIKILFIIKAVKENKAVTEIMGYGVIPAYIKRLSKVSKGKVDISMKFKTKDNINIVVKTTAFTRNKTTKRVLTAVRKKTEELLNNELHKKTYDEIIKDIVFFKLQKRFQYDLKKIIPISNFMVRKFQKLK